MAGRCDDQHQYKEIFEAAMVSTPELFTDNSPIYSEPYVTVKIFNVKKSICLFSETLDVKPKTAILSLCATK